MLKLVRPNIKFKKTYLQAAKEYKKIGMFVNVNINEAQNNFSEFVKKIKSRKLGKNLPSTYPNAEIEYWLLDDNTFVGRIGIREKLNKLQKQKIGHIGISIRPSKRKIGYGLKGLKLSLTKAKQIGLKNIILVCKKSNLASKKIIEKLGGKLIEELSIKNEPTRLRYRIKLK